MPTSGSIGAKGWIDGHLDIAYVAEEGRDCTVASRDPLAACVTFPDLAAGRVKLALATIFTEMHAVGRPAGYGDAEDREGAHAAGLRQLRWYQSMESAGHLRIVRTARDLERAAACLDDAAAPLSIVLLMECADPIRTPDEAAWWFNEGVRVVGMSWARGSRYAGGNAVGGPLTDEGRDLVDAFDDLGILHDASHLSDESLDELLEQTSRRVVATHSNARALLAPKERHLADRHIAAIAERGGVVGLNLYGVFLAEDRPAVLEDCVRHIEHVRSLGGPGTPVLGSDLDGGFTPKDLPEELRHPRDLERLTTALAARGTDDADLDRFRSGNWLRVLRSTL
jgi:membrane dipeptidase